MLSYSRLSSLLPLPSQAPAQHNAEQKKIIISSSTRKVLWCCVPHVLPIATSITILTLNFHGIYIGADFATQTITLMSFQIAAKVHEIFIVASLSVIVFHAVRFELLYGDGLPLGLVGSGFNFGSFGFFFTKEFRGGLLNAVTPGHKLRKTGFIILLCVAGLIAALAGPSSATLIVPALQTWQAGGTHFYLNGSLEDFWPSDVSRDALAVQDICNGSKSTELAICPAGGYLSIREHWSRMNYTNFYTYDVPTYAKKLSGSRFYWPIHSPASSVPPRYTLGNARNVTAFSPGTATFFVQPHAAASTLMQTIANKWWTALQSYMKVSDRQVDDRKIGVEVLSAITTIRCSDPQNLKTSENSIHFPAISGRFDYVDGPDFIVDSLNTSAVDHVRFQWVHLPDRFGSVSIGAVLESAWNAQKTSRVAVGCSVQAGWLPTSVYTDEYSFWTGWYPWDIEFGGQTPSWVEIPASEPQPATNGRVAFSDDWLSLLNPTVSDPEPSADTWTPSVMESIIGASGLADDLSSSDETSLAEAWVDDGQLGISRTVLLESIISSVVTDGLGRSGAYRIFDTQGSSSEWPISMFDPLPDFDKRIIDGHDALQVPRQDTDITTLRIKMQITGYALKRSLTGALAVVVLLAHIILATGHIVFVLVKRQASNSWDSISELIALSQNSRPAYIALANTGAGINERRTYGRLARIRATSTIDQPDNDHVELVFEGPDREVDHLEMFGSTCYHGTRREKKSIPNDVKDGEGGDEVQSVRSHFNQELDNSTQLEPVARQQWTWPRNPDDGPPRDRSSPRHVSQAGQSPLPHSRTGSRERLIVQSSIRARRAPLGELVRVDQAYG
ncbi:hypothetical protein H2202_004082 [Exophiala xenobiotica]|nr:hypothetical protein H2202_004082 [Exophiala xenobiotica]KAK5233999.1 hypothetical protein LTR47_005117 [Exophiala xenobiotica]KAK5250639.1 hypothetical protein LTS06_004523 [Exophiala xenobiotica]KAK5326618.1 hypothetical protein LTR93_003481 [Exophiala xenobiotica]KAK5353309.1 hypothetical protein LTR61_003267 [Exophiala xenobiotica]